MQESSKKRVLALFILIILILGSVALWFFKFKDLSKINPSTKAVLSKVPIFNSKLKDQEKTNDIERREKLLADEWEKLSQVKLALEKDKDQIARKEADLEKRRSELDEIEKELSADREKLDSTLINIKELTRYYELMEAKTAAQILGILDNDFIIQLFKNMTKEKVAEILSMLDTKKAAAITQQMSGL